MMTGCTSSPLFLTTMLLLLTFGSMTQAFVTTAGPQSSTSPGSPSNPTSIDNVASSSTSNDDDSEENDEDDDFSSMMNVPAAASPGGQTVYVIEFETEADKASGTHRNRGGKDMSDDGTDGQSPLDPWSIVWYIGSFGGLIAFFLIVSCSEWCCRRGARPLNIPYTQRGEVINATGTNAALVTESPPPPYHLFAPPPYDSVNYAEIADSKASATSTGEKLDIYVISLPIQAAAAQPPPA